MYICTVCVDPHLRVSRCVYQASVTAGGGRGAIFQFMQPEVGGAKSVQEGGGKMCAGLGPSPIRSELHPFVDPRRDVSEC